MNEKKVLHCSPKTCVAMEVRLSCVADATKFLVHITTWNVAGRTPECISLSNMLNVEVVNCSCVETCCCQHQKESTPDLYVIGLQEVSVHPHDQLLGLFREDPWTTKARTLLAKFDYVLLKSQQMQGLLLNVFIKRRLLLQASDIQAQFSRTGFGNMWGNKGAISIRLTILDRSMAFVMAHLAAHDHRLEERVRSYQQIVKTHTYQVGGCSRIFDHDYVFWFGDLNFRLEGNETAEQMANAIYCKQLKSLLALDQLQRVRETMQAFERLQESCITFPPTFKFMQCSHKYDLKRRPAWTDRILYAAKTPSRHKAHCNCVTPLTYACHDGYSISDHRPVSGIFTLTITSESTMLHVEFKSLHTWTLGRENTVEYVRPFDLEEQHHDWIGIYASGFDSLEKYVAYEYVDRPESSSTPEFTEASVADVVYHTHCHPPSKRVSRKATADGEQVQINFSEYINLKEEHSYCLLYFQYSGPRGITTVAGISDPFVVVRAAQADNEPQSP